MQSKNPEMKIVTYGNETANIQLILYNRDILWLVKTEVSGGYTLQHHEPPAQFNTKEEAENFPSGDVE